MAETDVRIGDVKTHSRQSSRMACDLIAVGSHGQRSIHDFLLGSVAESVARRAKCSVAIVRKAVSK